MAFKIQEFKKKMFFKKFDYLLSKSYKNGKITKFDDEIYDKMSTTIISCLPVSLHIKYSDYLFPDGTCYQRSLYMFLALDDALLVRGKTKSLEYRFGLEEAGHGWVEIGNYVYDPSLMLKFDKGIYYSLYGCSDISKIDKETYMKENKEFIGFSLTNDLDEFRPNGKNRLDLGLIVYQLKVLSNMLNDSEFTKDLNDYLDLVQYDEEQIYQEQNEIMKRILTKMKKQVFN